MAKGSPINVSIRGDYNDADIKRAISDLNKLQASGMTTAQRMGAVGASMASVGKSMTMGLTLPIVAGGLALVGFAKGAEEAEIANRKLESVLTSMGYGEASARVSAYAEELERTIAVDADVIKATQTKLATFKNLTKTVNDAGGAFDRATMAALDLAAAGFGSAETNAIQLGKALQDPVKGITALARAGVTFTDSEKAKIKTLVESNKTLEAQDMILKAIEKQVGGTAKAGASSFDKLKLSLLQIADSIGAAVLPLIQQLADFVGNTLVPVVVPFVTRLSAGFQALPGPIKAVAAGLVILAAAAGPVIFAVGKMMTAYAATVGGMSRANMFLRTSFAGTWLSMKTTVSAAVLQIKASMIVAQTQAGALAAGVRTAGVIAITSLRGIAVAAKGLLTSMGPIGIAITAATIAMGFFMNRSEDLSGIVSELKGTVDETTGAFTDLSAAMIGRDFRIALSEKDLFNLQQAGISVNEFTTAVMSGPDAVAALDARLIGLSGTFGTLAGGADTLDLVRGKLNTMNAAAEQTRLEVKAVGEANKFAGVTAGAAGGAVDEFGNTMDGAAGDAAALAAETKSLSDSFKAMDADIAAIRAKDEFKKLMAGMDEAIAKNNRSLTGNSEAARTNRDAILDGLESARDAAVAWGDATGATTEQVEAKFATMAENLKKTAVNKGFKQTDIENLFGRAGVNKATSTVGRELDTGLTTMASNLKVAAYNSGYFVGKDLGNGLSVGIKDSSPQVDIEARRAINNAERAARNAADSNSPSKLFAEVGKDLAKGLAVGVKSESDNLKETLRKTFTDWYDNALDGLRAKVKEARSVFKDFKAAISGQLTDSLDITAAYESLAAKQQAVDEARKAVNEARAELGDAPEQSALDKVNELQAAYDTAVAQAAANGGTLIGEFNAQAEGVVAFSQKMLTLMNMGLDPALWQQVYNLGAEKGTGVVDSLIAGGVEGITTSNAILETVQAEADRIGQEAASRWKQSGIDSAKATVKGFIDRFGPDGAGRKRLSTLMDNLANSMNREATITVTTINKTVGQVIQGEKVTGKAMGGPVSANTTYLVGERGPELLTMGNTPGNIIPNHDLPLLRNGGSAASGSTATGSTINLTVNAGMGTDGYEMGRVIVDSIKKYERVSGPVFAGA